MNELEICRAWRRLMLDDDGQLLPDAEAVLRDLEAKCKWMVSDLPIDGGGRVDPYRTAADQQVRGIYAHVKKRLFKNLENLSEKEIR